MAIETINIITIIIAALAIIVSSIAIRKVSKFIRMMEGDKEKPVKDKKDKKGIIFKLKKEEPKVLETPPLPIEPTPKVEVVKSYGDTELKV